MLLFCIRMVCLLNRHFHTPDANLNGRYADETIMLPHMAAVDGKIVIQEDQGGLLTNARRKTSK